MSVGGASFSLAQRGGMSVRTVYRISTALVIVAGLALGGCQNRTAQLGADPISTASTGLTGPSFKRTEALGTKWKADQADVATAAAYAESLDELGQKPTQIDVLRTTAQRTTGDAASQAKVGRLLLAAGDPEGAEQVLSRAVALNPKDVQSISALGASLDQQTKHAEAREQYQAALAMKPDDVNVMNNLGMSYALQGKLPDAETTLRKAMNHPAGRNLPRIRQNLALVIGLQGRFDEAKRIASEDLPPDQVQANMDYLQQMLSRPNTWQQLQQKG